MKKLIKLYLSGLVVTTITVTGTAVFFSGKSPASYGPSEVCRSLVNPERGQFKAACQERNSKDIGDLTFREIDQRKIDKLTANNCPNLENWYCELDHQAGEYRAFFYNRLAMH